MSHSGPLQGANKSLFSYQSPLGVSWCNFGRPESLPPLLLPQTARAFYVTTDNALSGVLDLGVESSYIAEKINQLVPLFRINNAPMPYLLVLRLVHKFVYCERPIKFRIILESISQPYKAESI